MTAHKPYLLQLTKLPILVEETQTRLNRHYRVLLADTPEALKTALKQHGAEIELVVTSAMTPTPASLIEQLPALKAICSVGVGYDSIDIQAAKKQSVVVSNTPDVLNDCVADMAFGLILATMRGIGSAERYVRRGAWTDRLAGLPLGSRVSGKKLGIVGLGRIGTEIAQRASGFRMPVRYHNRRQRDDVNYPYEASLQQLAQWADILVIATVGGAQTHQLINHTILQALGPEGVIVNIARGSVIDQDALITALETGQIAGAGLDVYVNEPHVPERLKQLENVVLLPHIASATHETREDMLRLMLDNVESFAQHGRLITPVND
ncbi:MAG TPA: 2-hydroxyacid dehydrogenase [Burkholderiaceae bacterium]|nr:2-hydroxyacid dehydrogenase [Burkholderiaceae bacterium]